MKPLFLVAGLGTLACCAVASCNSSDDGRGASAAGGAAGGASAEDGVAAGGAGGPSSAGAAEPGSRGGAPEGGSASADANVGGASVGGTPFDAGAPGSGGTPEPGLGEARCLQFGKEKQFTVADPGTPTLSEDGYLYIQTGTGLRAYDVSDPTQLTPGKTFGSARTMEFADGRAWTSAETRVDIYDLTDPSSPESVGGFGGTSVAAVFPGEKYVAVFRNPLVPGTTNAGYLSLYDATEIGEPTLADELEWPFRWGAGAAFYGNYLYVASIESLNLQSGKNYDGLLQVFDISTGKLTKIREYKKPRSQYASIFKRFGRIEVIGDTGYISDEEGLMVFDPTDPLHTVPSAPLAGTRGMISFRHSGNWIGINAASGLIMVDIQQPKTPVVGASFSTISFPSDYATFGFSNGLAALSYLNFDRIYLIPMAPCAP